MTTRTNQLKIDYYASNRPLAKAEKLDQREDGFEGGLICEGIIMAPEVLVYRQPDGSITRELRSADEIRKALERGTLQGKPFTNDHPPDMLTAADAARYAKGSVLDNGRWMEEEGEARTRFAILDAGTARDFEQGKRCLSVGVYSDDVEQAGVWNGQPYDIVQTNLRFNHLALVDAGRHSSARARMDSADTEDSTMTMKKITIGRDVVEVDEAGYGVIKAKLDEMDEMQKTLDEMEEKSDMDYGDKLEMIMELLSGMDGKMDVMKEAMDMLMPKKDEEGGDDDKDMDGMYGDKMDAAIDAGIKERLVLIGHLATSGSEIKMDEAIAMDAVTLRREIVATRAPSMKDAVATAEGEKLDGMLEMALSIDVSKAKVDSANDSLAKSLAPKRDAATNGAPKMSGHRAGHEAMLASYKDAKRD